MPLSPIRSRRGESKSNGGDDPPGSPIGGSRDAEAAAKTKLRAALERKGERAFKMAMNIRKETGTISKRDFEDGADSLGVSLTSDMVRAVVKNCDPFGSGSLDIAALLSFCGAGAGFGGGAGGEAKADGGGGSGSGGFQEGEAVEARYGGKAKYYPGKITRVRSNGTYDIRYDDGDSEMRVSAEMIRSTASKGRSRMRTDSSADEGAFQNGQEVEARYGGKSKYYSGKISRVRSDGTYDIRYDDGDSEMRVAATLIRAKPGSSRPRMDSSADEGTFEEGEPVEARYGGKSKYYGGKISRVRSDGTYDIRYNDGDSEMRVRAELIRSLKKKTVAGGRDRVDSDDTDAPLSEGDKVEARYGGKSRYYPGKIERVRADGSYDIRYDDGDREMRVRPELVRRVGGSSKAASSSRHGGAAEDALKRMKKLFQKASESQRGGVDSIREVFEMMDTNFNGKVDRREFKKALKQLRIKVDEDDEDALWDRFDSNRDGEIKYTEFLDALDLRGNNRSDASDNDGALSEGEKCEARYGGKSKYYPGKVERVRSDGTYDIRYDDGDREMRVKPELVRRVGGSSPKKKKVADSDAEDDELNEGDKVEARYGGKSKYYSGKITRVRSDGTFNIRYDDGDIEMRVKRSLIRKVGGSPQKKKSAFDDSSADEGSFEEGDKVEARFGGKSKYYPGKITRVRSDGTYDIRYEDGDSEMRVKADLIRKVGGGSPRKKKVADSDAEDDELNEGDKVEARYGGKSKYYSGKITRVRSDGTFDIRYDDGDSEMRVKRSLIRKVGGSPQKKKKSAFDDSSADEGSFEEGDKVEARFGGKSKYYPGKITRVRSDGTYDIRYEDGDSEMRVKADLIRKVGGGSTRKKKPVSDSSGDEKPWRRKKVGRAPSDSSDQESDELSEGDKVEARFGGKAKYYPGKITRVRSDGTYDIRYEDGDSEMRVKRSLIRKKGGSSTKKKTAIGSSDDEKPWRRKKKASFADSSADESAIEEGDKVEARFGGKAKYYPGKVERVRADGTFDIRYDDGDREMRVKPNLVRKAGGKPPRSGKKSMSALAEAKMRKIFQRAIETHSGGVRGFRDVFELMDTDMDSKVSRREFGRALKQLRIKLSERQEEEVWDHMDQDGSGQIDYAEFIKWCDVDDSGEDRSSRKPSKLDDSSADEAMFREGEKVEARFGGKSKYYSGKITRVRSDGTYDIRYDDGDSEMRVKANLIRSVESTPPRKKSSNISSDDEPIRRRPQSSIREGDPVEARFGGKKKYYKGTVTRVRADGSYDIKYEDGDRETRVDPSLVKAMSSKQNTSDVSDDDDFAPRSRRAIQRAASDHPDAQDGFRDAFDRVGSGGRIDRSEFAMVCKRMRVKLDGSDVKKLFNLLDANGSGEIRYRDLERWAQFRERSRSPSVNRRRKKPQLSASEDDEPPRRRKPEIEPAEDDDTLVKRCLRRLASVYSKREARGAAALRGFYSAFTDKDRRGKGRLSEEEFASACDLLDIQVSRAQQRAFLRRFDKRDEGEIDMKEVFEACGVPDRPPRAEVRPDTLIDNVVDNVRKSGWTSQRLLTAFSRESEGNREIVSVSGFLRVLEDMGVRLSEREDRALLREFDADGRGREVNFAKFMRAAGLNPRPHPEEVMESDGASRLTTDMRDLHAKLSAAARRKFGHESLKVVFRARDEDSRGTILADDMASILQEEFDLSLSRQELATLRSAFRAKKSDHGRTAEIDYSALAAFIRAPVETAHAHMPYFERVVSDKDAHHRPPIDDRAGAVDLYDAPVPAALEGSVGKWLEETASHVERRNFFRFLEMVSNFEKKLGLQQRRDAMRESVQLTQSRRATAAMRGGSSDAYDGVQDDWDGDDEAYGGAGGASAGVGGTSEDAADSLVVQLGSKLKVGIRFFV